VVRWRRIEGARAVVAAGLVAEPSRRSDMSNDTRAACLCGCGRAPRSSASRYLSGHNNKHSIEDPNPSGLCMCGCGSPTRTDRTGRHSRYRQGHGSRFHIDHPEGPNPSGLCMCGCGGTTPLAPYSKPALGIVRGTHQRFLAAHHPPAEEPYEVSESGCWIWQGATNGKYPTLGKRYVHRLYWERANGPIPAGKQINHLCFVPLCINPAHMGVATHAENCRRKRRMVLTEAQVADVKTKAAGMRPYGRAKALASEYGTSVGYMQAVIGGQVWKGYADVFMPKTGGRS
jgi:hypothetical protein